MAKMSPGVGLGAWTRVAVEQYFSLRCLDPGYQSTAFNSRWPSEPPPGLLVLDSK